MKRREFIKVSSLLGAGAAASPAFMLGGCAAKPLPGTGSVSTTPTICDMCFWKCAGNVYQEDGELWKIFYAYSTDTWPGMTFNQIVDDKFRQWFGPKPKTKKKTDAEGRELVTYLEWTALHGEKIRAFDMSANAARMSRTSDVRAASPSNGR